MKNNLIILAVIAIIFVSCYDETDPASEIIIETGKGFYPVSANTFVDLTNAGGFSATRQYAVGTNLSFELQYWSEDAIQEINMYSTLGNGLKSKIYSKPYAEIAAFSKIKSADTLVLGFKIPPVGAVTPVKLDVEIVNQNGLSLVRTILFSAKP